MKRTDIVVGECYEYSIVSDENVDAQFGDINNSDAVKGKGLVCYMGAGFKLGPQEEWPYINPSLYASFKAACEGSDPRWKLAEVTIEYGKALILAFADMEPAGVMEGPTAQRSAQSFYFPTFDGFLHIKADRPGSDIPDSYSISLQSTDYEEGDWTAEISESRNGKFYACEHLYVKKDGSCYLTRRSID